jgi:putative FmdB family regulatory protein
MPIYDFQCSSCGFKDEVMRKISAASIEACPKCGAETFSKQLSAPSFQLSGSGWYATDFKNGSAKPAAASTMSNPDAAKKNDSADTQSTDSGTAAKTGESSSEKKSEAAPAACKTGCACH